MPHPSMTFHGMHPMQVSIMVFNPANEIGSLVSVLIETPREGVLRITPDVLVMQVRCHLPAASHLPPISPPSTLFSDRPTCS